MKYYQKITIIPDAEITPYFIWSKLFMQVHLALVEQAKAKYGDDATHSDIGVSFPEYRCQTRSNGDTIAMLGSKLRVFAHTQEELAQLDLPKWLARLQDYVHVKPIRAVREGIHQHLIVSRYRQVGNMDRITRRYQRRANAEEKSITFEEAKAAIIERYAEEKSIDLTLARLEYERPKLKRMPYINMQSLSGDRQFALEIQQQTVQQAVSGTFNTYGLSSTTTVPHW